MHHQQNRPEHHQLFYYAAPGWMRDLLSGASVQNYNVLYNIQFIFVENLVTLNIQVWLSPGINIIPWSIALIL